MSEENRSPLLVQGGIASYSLEPEYAVNVKEDRRLSYLDIFRYSPDRPAKGLQGLRVIVIGAGPAGLVFARAAAIQGADVTVIEKAGDPRGKDPGYTNRSFNITLDNVGRQVLADNRAWEGGIWLSGRAIHNFQGSNHVYYTRYGKTSDAELISIPRPVLRQNLCNLAEASGAHLIFRACVTEADGTTGAVFYTDRLGRDRHTQSDLIVFSDGSHSLADDIVAAGNNSQSQIWHEPRSYITGMIEPKHNQDLSLNHIHFWHESSSDAFSVGILNANGSIALLLTSLFSDMPEPIHPFPTPKLAAERLRRDFPRLFAAAPHLPQQLPKRQRGQFCYKSVSRYRVKNKGIVVGDAGCVFPPWAGYGANQAMYAAASLAHILSTHKGDVDTALPLYEKQQKILAGLLMSFVSSQGDFLSGPVTKNPSGRSDPALGPLILQARRRTQIEFRLDGKKSAHEHMTSPLNAKTGHFEKTPQR